MRAAGIVGNNAAIFDDEAGDSAGGVFTVDQHIGGHFPKDVIAQTAALNAFQVKRVGQVFLNKSENAIVAVDKVGDHQVPIVVAVGIHFAQEQVGAVGRADLADLFILAEQHHAGQGNAGLAGFGVAADQLGALQQAGIVQGRPGVVFAVEPNVSAALVDQVRAQAAGPDKRVNPILTIGGLLALIKAGHLHREIGDIQIGIFVAVINTGITAMHLRAFGHIDMQQRFAVQFSGIDGKVGGRREFLGIVNRCNEILADTFKGVRIDTCNGALVRHPQQQGAPMAVQKGADRLVYGPRQLPAAGLELAIHPFAAGDQSSQMLLVGFHG